MYQSSVGGFLGGWFIGMVFLGGVLMLLVPDFMSYADLAACAVGQDERLRETTGIAEVQVTFKDGKPVELQCLTGEAPEE